MPAFGPPLSAETPVRLLTLSHAAGVLVTWAAATAASPHLLRGPARGAKRQEAVAEPAARAPARRRA
jgi:hypothetical protein